MSTIEINRRRRWPWVLVILFGFLVALYFVVTSGAFLRSVVLPRIGAALNSEVTAEYVSLSPFSSLTLRQLKVTPNGAETLATVQEIRLRYSLWAILRGTVTVTEATIETPVVTIVGRPDGTSNLGTLMKALPPEAEPPPANKTAQLDIHSVALRNGTVRQSSASPAGSTEIELSNLNVTLDQLVNGAASKLTIGSLARLTANATNQLAAKADGAFGFEVDSKLLPTRFNGALDIGVTSAGGLFRDFGKVAVKFSADATGHAIREWRLAMTESGRPVGELFVSGPFDPEKKEMQLDYELKGVDRNALGILGAAMGVDFGQTTVKAKGKIEVAQAGQSFSSQGTVAVERLSIKSTAGTTPVLDSAFAYRLQVDLQKKTARIDQADLSVQQGNSTVIKGALDQPMNLAWDTAVPGFQAATYNLSVKQFDLAPWRSVAGTNFPAGRLNLEASITTDRDGRRLKFAVGGTMDQVAMVLTGKAIRDLTVGLNAGGSVEDFQIFTLEQATGEVRLGTQPLAKYSALGHLDQKRNELGGQLSLDVQLPTALKMYPVDGLELTSGTAQVKSQFAGKSGKTNGTLNASLAGLTGKAYGAALRDHQATLEAIASVAGTRVNLSKGSLAMKSGATPLGGMEVTGDCDQTTARSEFDLKLDLMATPKSANRLQTIGRFDFKTNGATPSSLNLTSDGLDFTPLYNAFAAESPNKTVPPPPTPAPKPSEPTQLPLQEFTLDSKIAKVFLRDIAVSNWVTKVTLNRGKIALSPFTLTLNGAPVSAAADLDLNIPGYKYDLSADLQSVPVTPIARSVLKGQLVDLKGTLNGKMKLGGTGREGADLRKHLNGTVTFAATNLDYQVTALQTPLMQGLMGTLVSVLRVPNISQSPIQGMAAQLEAGQGALNIKSAQVNSAAFVIDAKGQLQFADILTNSPINIPISVSLPKEGRFEPLPQFLTMRGTLGAPKPELNPLGVAQLATQLPGSAGALVNQGVGQLGGALDKALGQKGSTNPGTGTALIKGLLGGGTQTNAPPGATNTNAPARPFNPLDLLKKSNP
ncbi:MAG TPA: hypothetical protein DCE44_24220 [Verrucomicrobiales bacterium]|nr:hypothetical protein [Verrucomicrobiales bacterium]